MDVMAAVCELIRPGRGPVQSVLLYRMAGVGTTSLMLPRGTFGPRVKVYFSSFNDCFMRWSIRCTC